MESTKERDARRFERHPDMVARRIADEMILVPIRRQIRDVGLYTMNELGAFIWERLDGTRDVSAIVEDLLESYEVSREEATADFEALLGQLKEIGGVREI